MKPNRVDVLLVLFFALQGCSQSPEPVSTNQPEASQSSTTSASTDQSAVQAAQESSGPPPSAGTEALIEGLSLPGINEAFAQSRAAYDNAPQDRAAATQFITLIEQLGITLSQQGNKEQANRAFTKAAELLDTALKANVQVDPQVCSLVYYNCACAKALENQANEALALLEKSMSFGFGLLDELRVDPDLAVVRNLPEFPKKLENWEVRASEVAIERDRAAAASDAAAAERHAKAIEAARESLALTVKEQGAESVYAIGSMNNLAAAYFQAGRPLDELQLREEVVTLSRKVNGPEHPNTVRVMDKLADCYAELGKLDEAAKVREELLTIYRTAIGAEHPNTLKAMKNLLFVYHAARRQEEAVKLTSELLALTPDDAAAHNDAAWVLATRSDKDGHYPQAVQAVAWARRACELSPNNGSFLNTLGLALYRAEQWQEASDILQKSVELGVDAPHNWLFIAMSYWQLDQKDKAKEWYDKSLAVRPAVRLDAELHNFFQEADKLMLPDDAGQLEVPPPNP